MWDPGRYRQFGAERSRPFDELVGRIGASDPAFVADLGCGPGELTADLCERWPAAEVLGVDSSAEMIAAAREVLAGLPDEVRGRLRFEQADAANWEPDRPVDVMVSNAMLQWLPEHEKLLPRWVSQLAPGGWLAFAVPGNFDEPTHGLLRQLAATPRWRAQLAGVAFNRQAADPAEYLDLLARVLPPRGLVLEIGSGTGQHVAHFAKALPALSFQRSTRRRLPSSWPPTARCCASITRASRMARCCRSGGSSRSLTGTGDPAQAALSPVRTSSR